MCYKNIVFAFLLFAFSGFGALAQLKVNFPAQRAIFQRDNSNNGQIHIHGYVPNNTSRVEARLLPVATGQGTQTDWITIDSTPRGGSFVGSISGKGGWYVLQLRSFENEIQNGSTQVDKVGIGEIFILAGQSNAQGLDNVSVFNPKGASDDRVNAYTHYRVEYIDELPPIGEFSQLSKTVNIGPHGNTAWAWGELGDRLVRDLNVPVMFYNTGYEATTIENWRKSAKGEPTILTGFNVNLPNQTPYSFLRILLQNHVSVYGLRSVLWMQGESDKFFQTSAEQYYQDLKLIIEKTRTDTGKTINWMVSRTSLENNASYPPVIEAQNRVISDLPSVFAGPQTDFIQNPRFDGVHLSNTSAGTQGLSELANAFKLSLSNSFFQNSSPIIANPVLKPVVACNTANFVQLSIPGTFSSILWNKTGTTPTVIDNSGVYQAITRDAFGNYNYSAQIDISKAYPSVSPQVSPLGDEVACVGDELKYTTDRGDFQVVWQDGSISRTFTSQTTENIFAIYQNTIGCKSNQSNVVKSNFVDKPAKPVIVSPTGSLGACEGSSIQLRVQDSVDKIITWSDGTVGENITIATPGKSSVFAIASTPLGCFSEQSEPFEVEIVSHPEAPEIFQTGPYTIGIERLENQKEYEWYDENFLLQTTTDNQLQVPQDGFYKVLAVTEFPKFGISCASAVSGLFSFFKDANITGLKIYPIPVVGGEFYLASDRLIKTAQLTLMDDIGRIKMVKTVNDILLPQTVTVKNNQLAGKYFLKVDYDGFYKVFPLVFE
ncbi:hypothetical protein SAMN06298216_0986 [Spirosomataceae bacterium TFI 002]|nr:hypothetical protein SAMN06298216_0986 [Spirosomataceae bacterium TFI 002]